MRNEHKPKNEIANRGTVDVIEATEVGALALQLENTKALSRLADATKSLVDFLKDGGLAAVLQGQAKANMVGEILNGLASHSGRNALDARLLAQNATEIAAQVEAVFDKFQEKLKAKAEGVKFDPEIHDAEKDFKERS